MRYCYSLTYGQLAQINALQSNPHVGFEIRLDSFDQAPDATRLRELTTQPLLATYRSKPHLGLADPATRNSIGWDWRRACLLAGFPLIDLELDEEGLAEKIAEVHAHGAQVVLSHHDLGDGAGLQAAFEHALASDADIIKIIATGSGTVDVLRQRAFYQQAAGRPLVHFAMGAELAATRVFCLLLGSPFTFITPDASTAVAPGQLTFEQLHQLYQPLDIDVEALRLFAVIGAPIGHSRSPSFHNPLLKEIDPNALFVALPAACGEDLDHLLTAWPQLTGMAVTKPMKEAAFARADGFLDQGSESLGAVNTLIRQGSRVEAANTDLLAMMELLADAGSEDRVLVLGYGGLGKAVVAACNALGLEVEVCNRTAGRIPAGLKEIPWASRHDRGATIIVQATSAGMAPHLEATALDTIPTGTAHIIETVYNPSETLLMRMAYQAGIRVTDGHALFEGQARIQNRFFRAALAQS